jgi:ABC-type glycerol-3-phosphate transport system substrate-binding protein
MFKRKIAKFLVFVLISTLFLTACRTKEAPLAKEDFTGIELTYYKMFDDSDVIEPIINAYEIAHPGLTINYKKFDDFEEYQDVILNEMAEGEGPDIFSMQNTWFADNYRKISPMPNKFGTASQFEQTFVAVALKDLIFPNENGAERVYAVPMTVDTLALYFNKDHFEDRLPAQGRPSATWEGIKEDVAQLNKEDNSFERFEVSGIALGRSDNISRAMDILYLLFLQFGADFYNGDASAALFAAQTGSGASNYPGVTAMEFFTGFADEDHKHYSWNKFLAQNSGEEELEAFARGKVSMIVGYSFTYDDIVNEINVLQSKGVNTIDVDAIKIAAIPQVYDPDVSTEKRVTYASYFSETVSRNSAHSDIAWDFLIELTKKENLETYFEALHKPTSRRDMIEDQKQHPIYGVFAGQIGYAESFPIVDYYDYKEIFEKAITAVNDGESARSVMVGAQDQIDAMLPSEGLIRPLVQASDLPATTEGAE